MKQARFIIATLKDWNIRAINDHLFNNLPMGYSRTDFELYINRSQFEDYIGWITKRTPEYIFFPHWSWKIPEGLTENFTCIGFHSSDLPFGKGGSPIQNLISRGYTETKITAFRITKEFDSGPIYLQRSLSLEGSAQEIYVRSAVIIADMIREIILTNPEPREQEGEEIIFKRRKPEESEIKDIDGLDKLYDHIRMVDADTYPRAYLIHDGFRYEFSDALLQKDVCVMYAKVKIEPIKYKRNSYEPRRSNRIC